MICAHKNFNSASLSEALPLLKCKNCGVIFSKKLFSPFDPKILYESFYKNEIAGRFNPLVENIVKIFRFFRAFKIFTINHHASKILDIGSGRGFMLYFLKKFYRYKQTVGTQLSKPAVVYSREKLGLEIYDKDLLDLNFPEGSFDMVTLWHVLEHLKEPEKYIEQIHELLVPGGNLVIEVPNYLSWTRRFTGKFWLGLDLEHHIFFFTPESLSDLLKKNGFTLNRIHTFSLEYSSFISTQSIISALTNTDQLFFQYLQSGKGKHIFLHIFLFIFLFPIMFIINLILYPSKFGEVLLVIAEKK